jgi:hypothetical protein
MGQEIPVREDWKQHLIATRTANGQIYLLVAIEKSACENCHYGTRVVTVWGSPSGEMQRIVWCTSCFNADCDPTDADEAAHHTWIELVQRLNRERELTCWNGAKAAVEALEHRALI